MRLNVGPWKYSVELVAADDERLAGEDGKFDCGRVIESPRKILISAAVAPHGRMAIILHELRHAWSFHVPSPSDIEEDCDLTATMMASVHDDLSEQGGVDAIERMRLRDAASNEPEPPAIVEATAQADGLVYTPLEQVEYFELPKNNASAGRAQCAVCLTIFAGGSIVTSAPRWHGSVSGKVVDRTVYCPHCNHLMHWIEGVNFRGEPNGAVAMEPEIVRDRDAIRGFLVANPEAVGVI